ncbi:hypothetical protein A8A01_00350 [Ewingella americana]|nr:hypothetical protein A8A01_00350 [Ewingella americana]
MNSGCKVEYLLTGQNSTPLLAFLFNELVHQQLAVMLALKKKTAIKGGKRWEKLSRHRLSYVGH